MARGSAGESVLHKHLRILDAFEARRPFLTLTEIADAADLSMSTAHRLVGELEREGLLERLPDRSYRLGVRLWEFASRTPGAIGLRELARPWLAAVHSRVRQHTQLGVLAGRDVLFVERMSTRDAVVNATLIGGRIPFCSRTRSPVWSMRSSLPAGRSTPHTLRAAPAFFARSCGGSEWTDTPAPRGSSMRSPAGSRCPSSGRTAWSTPLSASSCPTTAHRSRGSSRCWRWRHGRSRKRSETPIFPTRVRRGATSRTASIRWCRHPCVRWRTSKRTRSRGGASSRVTPTLARAVPARPPRRGGASYASRR